MTSKGHSAHPDYSPEDRRHLGLEVKRLRDTIEEADIALQLELPESHKKPWRETRGAAERQIGPVAREWLAAERQQRRRALRNVGRDEGNYAWDPNDYAGRIQALWLAFEKLETGITRDAYAMEAIRLRREGVTPDAYWKMLERERRSGRESVPRPLSVDNLRRFVYQEIHRIGEPTK